MESALAVSCVFQAVMAEGGAHRRGPRDPAHCLTVLGEVGTPLGGSRF